MIDGVPVRWEKCVGLEQPRTKGRHLSVLEPFLLYIYLSQFSHRLYALERGYPILTLILFWECDIKSLCTYNGKEVEHGQLDLWLIHIVAGSSQEDVLVKTQHAFQYIHYCVFNLF